VISDPGAPRDHWPGRRAENPGQVRGRAIAGYNLGGQSRYPAAAAVAAALGPDPEPRRFHLFAVDIEQVTVIRYDGATGGQHAALPPRCEFIRHRTPQPAAAATVNPPPTSW
jgi:hypothetical protein